MIFKNYFLLTRPFQWIKNIIIFIPLIFARKLFEVDALALSFTAFICFVLASSIIYIFNDICDIKKTITISKIEILYFNNIKSNNPNNNINK